MALRLAKTGLAFCFNVKGMPGSSPLSKPAAVLNDVNRAVKSQDTSRVGGLVIVVVVVVVVAAVVVAVVVALVVALVVACVEDFNSWHGRRCDVDF
jgi:hypothetical protein